MTLFPVFHPPCLFVFSVVFLFIYLFYFFFLGGGGICLAFSTFLFLIEMYLELNAVRYPYLLSLCYYSITYPTYVIYFSNFTSQRF